MSKVAHFELLPSPVYLIRLGPVGWKWLTPYEVMVVLLDKGNGVAEIKGLDKPLLPSHWRAITLELLRRGFEKVYYDRIDEQADEGYIRKTFYVKDFLHRRHK